MLTATAAGSRSAAELDSTGGLGSPGPHSFWASGRGNATRFGLLALVAPSWLDKDPEYQRDFDSEWAEEIAGGWEDTMCRPVNVRLRDGRLWVANGQHTAEAAGIAGVEEILVVINNGSPSRAAEAKEFVDFQTMVKRMRPFDVYRAALVAGDRDALVVRKVTTELGITVAAKQEGDPLMLTSITAARDLAGQGSEADEQALRNVLEIALEVWTEPGDLHRYRGRGLILMRGLMSVVEIGSRPDGSVVRMHRVV